MNRYQTDIAAISETLMVGEGSVVEKEYTFFWEGKSEGELRIHGVGFAISNRIIPRLVSLFRKGQWFSDTRWATWLSMSCIYALRLTYSVECKEEFHAILDRLLNQIPKILRG